MLDNRRIYSVKFWRVDNFIDMLNDKKVEQRSNLLSLYFLCDELAWGYNLLVTRILSKYGPGYRPADSSKGEKGVTFSYEFRGDILFDSQVNYLLRSFIFAGKSTSDQIFHTMAVMRDKIQPSCPCRGFPDASRPRNFSKFVQGFKTGRYDSFNPAIEKSLQNSIEVFIHLRLIRNNIKEFAHADFKLILGRPRWEFLLTKENLGDSTFTFSSIYTGQTQEQMTLIINLIFFELVFWASLEMFEVLRGLVENEADLLDFVTKEQVIQLRERQKQTEGMVASSNLYPYEYTTPDGVIHVGDFVGGKIK